MPMCRIQSANSTETHQSRHGKALVVLAICLPMIFGILGLVVDGSLLMTSHKEQQTIADAAATAAAKELSQGRSLSEATQAVETLVKSHNGLSNANVSVHVPPTSGPYAGNSGYVEVVVSQDVDSNFQRVFGGTAAQTVRARSVAGMERSTAGGVIVVLDPDPSPISVTGLPLGLPAIALPPVALGGLEILGAGRLQVDGGVFVNNVWGGRDENGDLAGETPPLGGLQHAVSATPIAPLTKLLAEDIRVTGGVDNPSNYGSNQAAVSSPLQAVKSPVPDPLSGLPAPTLAADVSNISTTPRGSVNIVGLPLLAPPVVLQPGVYESINIVSGRVTFTPGIYIIRGKHPVTGISLSIIAGEVNADGVMFYLTDSAGYSPADGLPDAGDGESTPAVSGVRSVVPSVVIDAGLLNSTFRGLNDPNSVYNGMLLFQRRHDRRPIVIVAERLLGSPRLSGTIYAKWGQLVLAGQGTYDLKMAVGTARILTAVTCTLQPTEKFPPVREVFLVE